MIATVLRWGVPLLVILSLALPAARLVWHAMGDSPERAAELGPPPAMAEAVAVDLSPILALAPFGQAERLASPELAPDDFDLKLNGVAISSTPEASSAFIAHEGATLRYGIGDTVMEGVTLTAVAPDHVRLDVEGEPRILAFADAEPPSQVVAAEPEPDAEIDPFDRLRAMFVPGQSLRAPERGPPQTMQDHIDLWRDRIRKNPQDVLDRIGLVAGPEGYTIAEQHDLGVAKMGLQPGDLVTRVNGQQVGDVDTDRALYDEIANAGLATVEIERGGEIITMSFPLR